MEQDNICRYIPMQKDDHAVHTVHFVLETVPRFFGRLRTEAVTKIYYVRCGEGRFCRMGTEERVQPGDLFFSFPSTPFSIEPVTEPFEYLYISFLGSRAAKILEELGIDRRSGVFHGAADVGGLWEKGIRMGNAALASESVLLFTFAHLGELIRRGTGTGRTDDASEKIKKYIDDHFAERDLSLKTVAAALSYNEKYVSAVFKKKTGVGVNEYLNTVRIQQAVAMIGQGFQSVNDIGKQCGFSDPNYFSRVFRKRMQVPPTEYIRNRAGNGSSDEKAGRQTKV